MVYDAAGNLIEDTGKMYTYDAENRMLTATVNGVTTNYFYDGEGKRIKKIVNGQVTRFVYGIGGELIAEYDGAIVNPLTPTKEYLYGATGLLAVSEGTTIKYLTPDHLGSTRVITDTNGQVVTRQDFYPFGREIEPDKAQRGSLAGYGAVGGVRQKFTGYERDEETGLDFAQARYYANSLGRFNSPDPLIESSQPIKPQSWNRYTYVLNNPLKFFDPTGLMDEDPQDKKQPPPPPIPTNITIEVGKLKTYEGEPRLFPDGASDPDEKLYGFGRINTIKIVDQNGRPIDPASGVTIRYSDKVTSRKEKKS